MNKYSFDKSKIKVLLLEGIHENAVRYFRDNGYTDIECYKEALSDKMLEEKLLQTHIIGIRSRTELRKAVLCKAPKLLAVGCFSIGTNQVDLSLCQNDGYPGIQCPFLKYKVCSRTDNSRMYYAHERHT